MSFAHPIFFALLPILIFVVWKFRRKPIAVAWSSLGLFAGLGRGRFHFLSRVPLVLRWLALALVVAALARPQGDPRGQRRSAEGLDIILVVDTSGSMRAQDFEIGGTRPSRLEVLKEVMGRFFEERRDDRIGMVVFGSEAFTQAPLTLDKDVLLSFLGQIRVSMAGDATAIGDGLATAVRRLEGVPGKGKVVILMTDGANNAGRIDPVSAAQAAQSLGIKVYTIGVGSRGQVPIEHNGRTQLMEVDIDEPLMTRVAETTGGQYFRATDTDTLRKIWATIDRLEKTRAEVAETRRMRELFAGFLLPALVLLVLEGLWSLTRWVRVPA
jgi:Ca-activated chloride channel family protein